MCVRRWRKGWVFVEGSLRAGLLPLLVSFVIRAAKSTSDQSSSVSVARPRSSFFDWEVGI